MKVGDRVVCKKGYYSLKNGDDTYTEYVKGEEYYIAYSDADGHFIVSLNSERINDRVHNLINRNIIYRWLNFNSVSDYFYTITEVRKLKLKKLERIGNVKV